MTPSLENILVLLIVGAAMLALSRRFYRFITSATSCGSSCGGCATKAEDVKSTLKPLVQLDQQFQHRP